MHQHCRPLSACIYIPNSICSCHHLVRNKSTHKMFTKSYNGCKKPRAQKFSPELNRTLPFNVSYTISYAVIDTEIGLSRPEQEYEP